MFESVFLTKILAIERSYFEGRDNGWEAIWVFYGGAEEGVLSVLEGIIEKRRYIWDFSSHHSISWEQLVAYQFVQKTNILVFLSLFLF